MQKTMLIGEIFFGVLCLITGTIIIYAAFTEKVALAPSKKFSGRATKRLIAYYLLGCLLFCLLGLLMILRGSGMLR
jgi:cytochrome b subunit of formate dehydrogenase